MAGGVGEVKVSFGLDTSKAESQIEGFFGKIEGKKVGNPFKDLDKSFDNVEQAAKELGLTWDNTKKKFKDTKGATASVSQVSTALKNLSGIAKGMGTDVKTLATQIKSTGDAAKIAGDLAKAGAAGVGAFGDEAQSAGGQVKGFGELAKNAGNAVKGMQLGTTAQALKGIGSGAKDASSGIQGLGTALKTTGTQLKSIGSKSVSDLKNVGTAASGSKGAVDSLSTSIKNIGQAFKGIPTKPLGQLGSSLNGTGSQVKGVATNFTALGNAIQSANAKANPLSALPPKIRAVGTAASTAKGQVKGFGDSFKQAGNESKGFVDQVRQGFQSIANGVPQGIGLAIGQGIITPLKNLAGIIPGAVEEFRALDESIRLTLGIAGAGQDQFGTLSASILRVSSASAATASEVGAVAQSLAKAGFSLQEVDDALAGVINGAEATGTAYETMGDIIVSAIGAFGLAANDASDVADTLVVAANSSNQSVTDLGEAIKYVGPIARSTGSDLQEVALSLGLLANNGIRGSQAGTALRTIMTNLQIAAAGAGEEFQGLARGSQRLEKALEAIGGNMTDANGELLTGKDLILELQRSFDGLSAGETAIVSKALAGAEGLPALNSLINASTDDIDALADSLEGRAGTAADQAKQALSGLAGSFKLLESNVSAALVQIGGVISAALKPLIDIVTKVIEELNRLPGPIANVLVALGLLGAGIGATVIALNALKGTQLAGYFTGLVTTITQFGSALTAANIQNAVAGIVSGLKNLATATTGALITGITGATNAIKGLSTALKGENIAKGFNTAISAISKGLKGIPAAGAATQLSLFSTAAGTAATSATAAGAASAGAAGGAAALGTAGAAGATGVGALAASLGAFLVVAAPFVAIGAGIVATFLAIQDRANAYKEVADPLTKSQEDLDKSLRKVGEGGEAAGSGYESWGKSLENFLGPLDKVVNVLSLGLWPAMKQVAEWLGKLNEWDRQRYAIGAANDAYEQFQQSLDKSNSKIEENRQAMASLNPESEEYGRLANENSELINAQKDALEGRITAIDETISAMEADGTATEATRARLAELKSEYQAQIGVIDANVEMIDKERRAYEASTGDVQNFKKVLNEATKEREKAFAKSDTQKIYAEAQARQAVTAELLTEKEAQAALAQATLDATDDKMQAVEDELVAIQDAYDQGGITQDEYVKRQQEAVNASKELIDERIEAEEAAKEALIAAIDDKMKKYEEEANFIATQVGRINQALNSITSIQSSGISAFKTLAQEVTNFQIQGIEKAKDKSLKATDEKEKRAIQGLDREEKRALAAIDASSDADEVKEKKRESLAKNFDTKRKSMQERYKSNREAAEEEYAKKRRSLMEKQIAFEKKALEAQIKLKKVELELWAEQETIATQLAIAQNAAAQVRAEAAGDDKLLDALRQEERILNTQLGQISQMKKLKGGVLKAEELIGKQQIATKADAEGIKGVYGGQVTSLEAVTSAMDDLINDGDRLRGAYDPLKDALGEIPMDAKQRAEETKRNIERGLGQVSFEALRDSFIADGISPQLAAAQAKVLTDAFEEASINAGDAAGTNILDRFGDVIPKKLIMDQLVDAFVDGSGMSVDQAVAKFNDLPNKLPTEQVAKVLGNAIGGGAQAGYTILANTPLPPGLFGELGAEIPTAIGSGVEKANVKLATLGTVGQAALNAMTGNIPELVGELSTFADETSTIIGEGFKQGVGPGFAAMGEAGINALSKIPEFLTNNALQDVTTGFTGVAQELVTWGDSTGREVGTAVNGSLLEGFDQTGVQVVSALSNIVPGLGPTLTAIETEFGVFGRTAGILFGQENVAALTDATTDVVNTVGGWFGSPDIISKAGAGGATAGVNWVGEFSNQVVPIIDQTATTVGQVFGDVIPKSEIASDLSLALGDGTYEGMLKAEEAVNNLPDFIPREEVARILGEGFGDGIEDGQNLLNVIEITDDTKNLLAGGIEEGLGEGAVEGTKGIAAKVEENKATVSTAIQESITAGFDESSGQITDWANKAGLDISKGLSQAGSTAAGAIRKAYEKELNTLGTKFSQLSKSIDVKSLKKPLQESLVGPVLAASTELAKLTLAPDFASSLDTASTSAEGVANSGIAKELTDANKNGAKPLKTNTSRLSSDIGRAVGPANSLARALERAARAAAKTGNGRFAGGPVEGGSTYTVNELGKEMFMSNTGGLSEIKAPAFGSWRAPSSGTVIPAGIAQQVRDSREAAKSSAAISSIAPTISPALRSANRDTGTGGNALIKAIKGIGGGTNQSVVNNVQIQSVRPALDASRVLTDLARLRATRRNR